MPGEICKAAICDDKAQAAAASVISIIDSLSNESPGDRIVTSEIYLKYIAKADKEVMEYVTRPLTQNRRK